ncbi:MAG TPA: S53 family peptidase [Chloroflexota bacterium]|nr:S53 family peptidase [Chloroflexota bacterium]
MRRLLTVLSVIVVSGAVTLSGLPRGATAHASTTVSAVCPQVPFGYSRCFALRVNGSGGKVGFTAPSGYGPSDLQAAYNLPSSTNGVGETVAIVDAFDDPTAEQDMNTYRSYYGLPACTSGSGCFQVMYENGIRPPTNPDWDLEISLDLDMVSAICPNCHIILAEATSNLSSDLYTTENQAAALGPNAMSNSYGASEYSGELADSETYFNHPGIAITASTGDSCYGVSFPAASQYVTAVGGTTLTKLGKPKRGRSWSETVWGTGTCSGPQPSGAGSGCSQYIPKPSWQLDKGCPARTVADVAADADPSTGVAIVYGGQWVEIGGTSVASPIIASVYALAGNTGSITDGSYPYAHTSSLFDVTKGNNGTCSPKYLCTGRKGYDGPTGLGTPNGVGAF